MNYQESLKLIEIEKQFLNTKDLKPFIKKGKSIYNIMEDIKIIYENEWICEETQHKIFDVMDSYDLEQYLIDRYKIKFNIVEDRRVSWGHSFLFDISQNLCYDVDIDKGEFKWK